MGLLFKLAQGAKDLIRTGRIVSRSPQWEGVRQKYLALQPRCKACGGLDKPEVHHVVPFHVDPSRELDPTNFITLCESSPRCHLEIGHHGNWKTVNPSVVIEAAKYRRAHREFVTGRR